MSKFRLGEETVVGLKPYDRHPVRSYLAFGPIGFEKSQLTKWVKKAYMDSTLVSHEASISTYIIRKNGIPCYLVVIHG
jgi:hypothetical protein